MLGEVGAAVARAFKVGLATAALLLLGACREQVGADRKILALNLEFRAADRTLTDEEVAGLREAIKAKLGEIGGTLRE